MLELWTDGSAGPTNPGPGGWSVTTQTDLVLCGSVPMTTNIVMEGYAILQAFRCAGKEPVTVRTDSQLWVNTVTKWAVKWERKSWTKTNGEPVKNLWLVQALMQHWHEISAQSQLLWVRGHGVEQGNILADYWAGKAREDRISGLPHLPGHGGLSAGID